MLKIILSLTSICVFLSACSPATEGKKKKDPYSALSATAQNTSASGNNNSGSGDEPLGIQNLSSWKCQSTIKKKKSAVVDILENKDNTVGDGQDYLFLVNTKQNLPNIHVMQNQNEIATAWVPADSEDFQVLAPDASFVTCARAKASKAKASRLTYNCKTEIETSAGIKSTKSKAYMINSEANWADGQPQWFEENVYSDAKKKIVAKLSAKAGKINLSMISTDKKKQISTTVVSMGIAGFGMRNGPAGITVKCNLKN